ncbi:Secretory immunoglobulin A-binding protein EsiB [Campylobacter majalis]|uniref:beta-lactamase n=1 Tax=Campylobacter majalis TaxID=2790656 RepID=A0ABM8Q9U2_9BACT|nr:tetratricopeptide repeat protein [Campylobacter majalis]CAD7289761.1 Secretory immunoglobulin A-binding protein EsiB [Campylobacter majalis]
MRILLCVFTIVFLGGCVFLQKQPMVYYTNDKVNSIVKGLNYKQNGEYKKAFDLFLRQANNQNDLAMYELGLLYLSGKGTQKDFAQAMYYFTKAAEYENTTAMIAAGQMHEFGLGVKTDTKKALKFYEFASKYGDKTADFYIASLFLDSGDEENAKIYYQKACQNGVKNACDMIGM